MLETLQSMAMKSADWLAAMIPQAVPDVKALQNCKIISHRGEHDNSSVMENTLLAFENARAKGVWGVECDIRWTADSVPVICHDEDCQRLFSASIRLDDVSFVQLREAVPAIPSLNELVQEFGVNTHLMLELKEFHAPGSAQQQALREVLSGMEAGRDYHMLALDPGMFEMMDFVEKKYCFAVSELNVRRLSRASLEQQLGGLNGHFYLLGNRLMRRHRQAGQRIGTGFISSKNCLFRELNRGVEWIFTNDAVKIQAVVDHYGKGGAVDEN